MGRNSTSESNNYWNLRGKYESSFFYSIHRATVTAIHVSKGTVDVSIEGNPTSREVTIPLLGLSYPPKNATDDRNFLRTSWGRYIPQKGDILLVGFDSSGNLHAMGYSAVYYDGLGIQDDANEDRGGIGWDSSSGKNIKPGDWDFKSSRNSSLYMGNKAVLSSGPINTSWDKGQNVIASKSGLIQENFGEASESRRGVGRRFILPTDSEETEIPSSRGTTCQELTDVVSYSIAGVASELARTSMGDVIDETLKTPKIGLAAAQPVRYYESFSDIAGLTSVHEKEIDTLGNFVQSSNTATIYRWTTSLSAWSITNLSTTITSTASISLTAPSCVITAPNIQLGSSAATSFAAKGTELITALNTFCIALNTAAVSGATASTGPLEPFKAVWTSVGTAATSLQSSLSTALAIKVKVE
jgi:hypothetical protein